MRSFVMLASTVGLALFMGAGAVQAISVEPTSPEQVLANAEMIVVGTVTQIETRWAGQGESMIATDYTIVLDRIVHDPQALFGDKKAGETIVLSFAGGTIDDNWVAIPGVPTYQLGEQAVFFIDGDWIHGISPLVGTVAGDYRISHEAGTQGVVTDYTGTVVRRSFFSEDEVVDGFSLDEFISEIERALPLAVADKSLELGGAVEIPDEIAHLVFTGDQIPQAQPIVGSFSAPSLDLVTPAQDAAPEAVPEPEEPLFMEPGELDQDELMTPSTDRYAFLWGPPDPTSNFNIPPIYYEGVLWGPNFEYSLSDWNRYADLFRKFAEADDTFGHQGRNDFAFTNWTTFQSVYGFSLPSSVLGIAVMYNSDGDNISVGEKIYESDIILNVDKTWTLDWDTGYNNCSVWYFRSTVIHEAGHCFGREHQFTADPGAMYHSVMNYPPCGALDTEFWLPFVDDPQSIRAAYSDRIQSIDDLGVELFRTAGGGGSSGIPVVWSTFDASVEAGQSFNMNNFIIENLGTVAHTPAIGWWLCPNQQNYTGAYYLMSTTHPELGTFAYWNTSRAITVPPSVPPGNYYIAAALESDDFDWNRSCWTNTQITVTCPQVSTPTGLNCNSGCGYIDLSWNAANNATAYRVYRDGAYYVTVAGTSYRDNTPGAAQRCYRVSGANNCDESGQSAQSCCTALSTPAPPGGFVCAPQCGVINLDWSPSSGATAYRVYRDAELLAQVGGTGFIDDDPGVNERCYRVTALNTCGESGAGGEACCTALGAPPASPEVTVTTQYCDSILVRWVAVAGATGYRIYRDGAGLASVGPAPTTFTDYVSGDVCYMYTVTTLNDCGEGSPTTPVQGCSVCEPDVYSIEGYMVYYDMVKHIPDVTVDLTGGAVAATVSNGAGWYGFGGLTPASYLVTPWRLDDDDGVSIADVVKIRRHLAVLELFDTPYKYVAADVSCDGAVSISDVVKIRRYLAELENLPCGNWIFIDSSFAISNANWATAPQSIEGNLTYNWTDSSFVGVRMGDVNNTWVPVLTGPAVAEKTTGAVKASGSAAVTVGSVRDVVVGDVVDVQIEATDAGQLSGVELHLSYSADELTFISAASSILSDFTANAVGEEIHMVWEDLDDPVDAADALDLFTLSFRVTSGMTDSGEIEVDGEIVDTYGDPYSAAWQSGWVVLSSPLAVEAGNGLVPGSYSLSANFPNPFNPETHIGFGLPKSSHVTLCIYNVVGRRVKCLVDGTYSAGQHQVIWNGRDDRGNPVGSGVYFYRLETAEFTQTRKMTLLK